MLAIPLDRKPASRSAKVDPPGTLTHIQLASIGGYASVSSVSVVYSNGGTTQTVSFSTNKGSATMSGEELKKAFNLRAPGYIGLKSSLYNIEKL